MIPAKPPDWLRPSAHEPSTLPQGAPVGPLRLFRRPVMTKTKAKRSKTKTKAKRSKTKTKANPQGQHPGRPWPARQLGGDRAWPPRHRAREPRQRVVGGDRARPQRRHAHAAVSRLPAAPKVLSASHRGRADESGQRSGLACSKSARAATAARAPSPLT